MEKEVMWRDRETETEKERLKVREMDGSGEKIEGIMGQSGQAERGEEAFLWVCVSWHIDRRPSKSRLCALLPQLHLANEKHHYATSTATPLRAKMWEEERGDDFLKGIVLSFWSEIIHEHELVLENTHKSHLYQSTHMHMLDCWWQTHLYRLYLGWLLRVFRESILLLYSQWFTWIPTRGRTWRVY